MCISRRGKSFLLGEIPSRKSRDVRVVSQPLSSQMDLVHLTPTNFQTLLILFRWVSFLLKTLPP